MAAALKNLAQTVTQLPPKDRACLAERLLDSLDEDEIEQAWMDVGADLGNLTHPNYAD